MNKISHIFYFIVFLLSFNAASANTFEPDDDSYQNCLKFSRPITEADLNKIHYRKKYGFNTNNIRIIDENSMLNGMSDVLDPARIDYYKKLIVAGDLLGAFKKFLTQSDFDKNMSSAERENFKTELLDEIALDLNNQIYRSLIAVFLASNEYNQLTNKYPKANVFIRGKTSKYAYTYEGETALPLLTGTKLLALPPFTKGEKSTWGYTEFSSTQSHTFHEFGHFIKQRTIGEIRCIIETKYARQQANLFNKNQFFSDLFYSDHNAELKKIAKIIFTQLETLRTSKTITTKNLYLFSAMIMSNIDRLAERHHGNLNDSMHDIQKRFGKLGDQISNKNLQDLANYLAEECLAQEEEAIWNGITEMMQIAGVFSLRGVLFVNLLSDFNLNVAKHNPIRWTHNFSTNNDIEAQKAFEREERSAFDTSNLSKHDINRVNKLLPIYQEFFIEYRQQRPFISYEKLNHPKNEALKTLFVLHKKDKTAFYEKLNHEESQDED